MPSTGVQPDFAAVRQEFDLPGGFPPQVLAEAETAAGFSPGAPDPGRVDATGIELVTIDPPGSKDLDQAVGIVRQGTGFRVHYAIADLGAVVAPGGALDAEVRRRGQTVYLPDGSVPLHPPVISEQAASLLPDGPRRAVLWTIDLDADGAVVATEVRRAVVRSRARLDYAGVQADVDAGRLHPAIAALPDVGRLRRAVAVARGAIELELPEQEVVPDGPGDGTAGWTVQVRTRLAAEDWNAEISLLTGTVAADMMLRAGVGLLRTLPAPDADVAGRAAPHRAAAGRRMAGRCDRGAGARRAPGRRVGARAGAAPGSHDAAARCRVRRVRGRERRRRSIRGTGASGRRTRTSPRRCAGSWTASAPRCAWRSRRASSRRRGSPRRCRSCRT